MRRRIDKLVESVLVGLLLLMVIVVVWQVAARYLATIIDLPNSSFTEELAAYSLIWLAMLGSAYVSGKGKHLAVDIIPNKVKPPYDRYLQIFTQVVILLFTLVVLVIGGGSLVSFNAYFGQKSASLGVPIAYVYAIVPISGMLILLYSVLDLKALLAKGKEIETHN
ncbi:MAG: TRAP transporter small permease [Cyclobacteriaceae bacterium]